MKYDFIIVGAGITGATCARLLTDKGYKCLIIEERPFVGGNCVSDKQFGIDVHLFGPHIFYTNKKEVWDFVNFYSDFNSADFSVYASNVDKMYSVSFDNKMIYDVYNFYWLHETKDIVQGDRLLNKIPENLEEFLQFKYGKKSYEKIFKNYFKKMFNKSCVEMHQDMSPIKQEMTKYNSKGFYNFQYRGIPNEGYRAFIEKIIGDDIDVLLNTNFLSNKEKYIKLGEKIIYTGEVDRLFNYCMGSLDWLSVAFMIRDEYEHTNNLMGTPIMMFSDENTKWYRITEHKWFNPPQNKNNDHTFVTYEYYKEWKIGDEAFYPIYTNKSLNLYNRYIKKLKEQYPSILICGRRSEYNLNSMGECIESAMKLCDEFPGKF